MKKLSFAEARAEAQAAKNNSDLANLASALEYIEAERQELTRQETAILSLATRIEAGEVVDVGEVKAAYQGVQRNARVRL